MGIRLSGMISGLDTDTMIQDLVKAYNVKKDNMVKQQTKLEWKQDSWKTLNSKIYSFYSKTLSPMQFSTAYNNKAAAISDSSKATVKASPNAVNGTQSLEIKQLASTGYLTGGKVSSLSGDSLTGSSKLSDLGITGEGKISVSAGDGTTKEVSFDQDMSIDKFTGLLKDAGVNANFDAGNQRFFISSKISGKDGDFSIVGEDTTGIAGLKKLGLSYTTNTDIEAYQAIASQTDVELAARAKKDFIIDQLNEEKATLTESLEPLNEKLSTMNLSVEDRAAKREELVTMLDNDTLTQEDIDKINADISLIDEVDGYITAGTFDDELSALNSQIETINADIDTINKTLADETELNEYVSATTIDELAPSYISILDDYKAGRAKAQDIVDAGDIVTQYEAADEAGKALLQADYDAALTTLGRDGSAVRIVGKDSLITLNGAEFTSNSNNFSINGLTITANSLTEEGKPVSITTETDVDAIYDSIKNMFKEYNSLIIDMQKAYGAPSIKGYEPLTDEEKDSMTDSQIEKWEAKIKDSLLRRDDNLNTLMTTMRNSMLGDFEVGGKKLTLASFGVNTLNFFTAAENEKGTYHIDGDPDNSNTSGKADKLRDAIAKDPESIKEFFGKLSQQVYSNLTNKMKSSSLRSAYTVYNDKSMKKEYNEYDEKIEKWEDKVANIEDKYVKQFAAMEKALSQLQSSTSALTSMLGYSQG